MEDQCSPLNWAYYYQEEGIDELKHSLLYTTLELETTVLSAREELARKDDELVHLKSLLTRITKERDEAIAKCQKLMLEKLLLQQQQLQQKHIEPAAATVVAAAAAAPSSGTTSNEDTEPRRGSESYAGLSSSDSDENVIASPEGKNSAVVLPLQPVSTQAFTDMTDKIVPKKPLPEKGKFLQAVMEAGPLLQTLLLAGPLPQWQHPPPQLSSIDIPPVTISSSPRPRLLHQDSCLSTCTGGGGGGGLSKKRVLVNSSDQCSDSSPPNSKYQRVVHQSSLTNNI